MRVLVVGAAGILAPAAVALRDAGDDVTGVGRNRVLPDGVERMRLDASSPVDVASALGERRWDAAIVYGPAVSAESLPAFREAVDGRCVLVRTSDSADPEHGPLVVPDDTLQLGWVADGSGPTRWHTAEQVSTAALQVLGDGVGRVLGAVRPWEDRP